MACYVHSTAPVDNDGFPLGQAAGGRIPSTASSPTRSELHTPERGSEERKAIMDALRPPVEKKLRQQVIFKVDHLKVQNGWAFLIGKPQRLDGTAVDYSEHYIPQCGGGRRLR